MFNSTAYIQDYATRAIGLLDSALVMCSNELAVATHKAGDMLADDHANLSIDRCAQYNRFRQHLEALSSDADASLSETLAMLYELCCQTHEHAHNAYMLDLAQGTSGSLLSFMMYSAKAQDMLNMQRYLVADNPRLFDQLEEPLAQASAALDVIVQRAKSAVRLIEAMIESLDCYALAARC